MDQDVTSALSNKLQSLSITPQPRSRQAAGAEGQAAGSAHQRVAGMAAPLQALRELVGWPLLHRHEGAVLGVSWPRGLLLHGPPGCGKTLMVQAVAEEFGAVLHTLTAASVFGAYMGESERRLRQVFEEARTDAAGGRPAVIFLDEIDALCPRRDGQRQHEARVVAQLLTLLDGVDTKEQQQGHVVVVAATNRPNALDPALRRPGRLDREVSVSVPDAHERLDILRLHTSGLTLASDLDLAALATSCHGYSGADLAALAREAAMHALSTHAESATLLHSTPGGTRAQLPGGAGGAEGHPPTGADTCAPGFMGRVGPEDFEAAMRHVGPSIVRGAEVEVARVRWEDVGGLEEVKLRLRQAVEWPLRHRDAFERLGLTPPRGVLLYGPPGCSKTSLARAAATSSRATMIPLSCAQLYSMYVGEGEALLRDTFRRARLAAPSIIFLDEVDAVAARRSEGESPSSAASGGSDASTRLLSTLLTEMDGAELATGVLVLAATNRPAAIDSALMRPGRLDVQLYVPPPDALGRLQVLQVHTRRMPLAPDVDLQAVAHDTEGFSGADLAGLCREAAIAALREDLENAVQVAARHFSAARRAKSSSLTPQVLAPYEEWAAQRGSRRAGGG